MSQLLFSTEIFNKSALEAFTAAFEQSKNLRYEFITPEVLLYNIVQQQEFIQYCTEYNIDQKAIATELSNYNDAQDRIPEDEEYQIMASNQFGLLLNNINQDYKNLKKEFDIKNKNEWDNQAKECKIDPADILMKIMTLGDDSIAKHVLNKYLGEDELIWLLRIKFQYNKDQLQRSGKMPSIKAEAYVNGKKIDLNELDPEMLYGKLITSAGRLIGAIDRLKQHIGDEDELEETRTQRKGQYSPKHEPWEKMVTCVNDVLWQKKRIVGREKEIDRCIRILCRRDKNNPIFIGEPGVGKSALIYGLAELIIQDNVPECLKGAKIYALDMASLIAGTSIHGEFEKRIKMILEGASRRHNSILFIDEIHTICDANGGNQSINAAEMMKPYLENESLRFIGCTTYKDYNKSIGNNKSLARRFGLIDVKEPSIEEAIQILDGIAYNYEWHHGVTYTDEAIRYAVEQSAALIHDRFLPDKAIDIIDEAGAYRQKNPRLNKKGQAMQTRYQKVDVDIIKHVLTEICRIDPKAMNSQDNAELKDMDKRLSNEIYGQDDAIRQVVRSVMMSKAGLLEPDKPIASLLFVGPTGVGKTEICKVLAKEMGMELVRFDMSEYTEKHTVSKLIGSPAGYVGYDEGGLLTDAIRKTPNCVLLLDEIEKAHPDIYNILLQVMDYARLTDNKGNKADFRNVILVMTSNAGAQYAGQASIGFGGGISKGQAMLTTVKKTFKPEFLNRLSGTVIFNDMDKTMAGMILDKKLRQLSQRLESKHVTFNLSPEAREFLLTKGFNPQYGGREMDRVIQQYLTPLLMDEILFGKLTKGGNTTIECTDDGKLQLQK